MKKSAFSGFLQFDGGVLDLDHETFGDLNVRNMQFASLVSGANFLPISREIALP